MNSGQTVNLADGTTASAISQGKTIYSRDLVEQGLSDDPSSFQDELVRQSQIVQSVILAVCMFDVCIFIPDPRVT